MRMSCRLHENDQVQCFQWIKLTGCNFMSPVESSTTHGFTPQMWNRNTKNATFSQQIVCMKIKNFLISMLLLHNFFCILFKQIIPLLLLCVVSLIHTFVFSCIFTLSQSIYLLLFHLKKCDLSQNIKTWWNLIET